MYKPRTASGNRSLFCTVVLSKFHLHLDVTSVTVGVHMLWSQNVSRVTGIFFLYGGSIEKIRNHIYDNSLTLILYSICLRHAHISVAKTIGFELSLRFTFCISRTYHSSLHLPPASRTSSSLHERVLVLNFKTAAFFQIYLGTNYVL
jgi:hypothetical protein